VFSTLLLRYHSLMAIFTKLLSNYDNNSSKYTGCSTGNYRGQYFQNYQTLENFRIICIGASISKIFVHLRYQKLLPTSLF